MTLDVPATRKTLKKGGHSAATGAIAATGHLAATPMTVWCSFQTLTEGLITGWPGGLGFFFAIYKGDTLWLFNIAMENPL